MGSSVCASVLVEPIHTCLITETLCLTIRSCMPATYLAEHPESMRVQEAHHANTRQSPGIPWKCRMQYSPANEASRDCPSAERLAAGDAELDSDEDMRGRSRAQRLAAGEFVGTTAEWSSLTREQRSAFRPPRSVHAAATADQPNIVTRGGHAPHHAESVGVAPKSLVSTPPKPPSDMMRATMQVTYHPDGVRYPSEPRGAAQFRMGTTLDTKEQGEDGALNTVRCTKFETECPWCGQHHSILVDYGNKNPDDLVDDLFQVYMPSELWRNAVRLGLITKCTGCSIEFEVRGDRLHRTMMSDEDAAGRHGVVGM